MVVAGVVTIPLGWADSPVPELDVAAKLKDARARGAKLYNGGDTAGCLEVFIKSLQEAATTLADHPDLRNAIRAAFREADTKPTSSDQALNLHEFLVKFVKDLDRLDSVAEFVKRGNEARSAKDAERAGRLFRSALAIHAAKAKSNTKEAKARDAASAHCGLGYLATDAGRHNDALREFSEAARIDPTDGESRFRCGMAHAALHDYSLMHASFQEAMQVAPTDHRVLNNVAWEWATQPDPSARDGAKAVEAALKACKLTNNGFANYLDTLAAAHATSGDFNEAVLAADQALLKAADLSYASVRAMRDRRDLFRRGKSYRRPAKAPEGADVALVVLLPAEATVKFDSMGTQKNMPAMKPDQPSRVSFEIRSGSSSNSTQVIRLSLTLTVAGKPEVFDLEYPVNRGEMKYVDAREIEARWRRFVEQVPIP
jgi:Flp pilus assembly protein TadD